MVRTTVFPSVLLAGYMSLSVSFGATYYVWRDNPAPLPPYQSWEAAATEIQQALDLASDGDTILVTNGVYETGGMPAPGFIITNRLCATNAVTIRSVAKDKTLAVIVGADDDGGFGAKSVRCAYLDGGATLSGFTLTGGSTHTNNAIFQDGAGGGVFINPGSIVSNCLIVTNSASMDGGGAICYDGGTIANCEIANNESEFRGGGVFDHYGGLIHDSLIHDNIARGGGSTTGASGGGVGMLSADKRAEGSIQRCKIYNNTATGAGGGIWITRGNEVIDSEIVGNVGGTGGIHATYGSTLILRCLIASNRSTRVNMYGGGLSIYGSRLENSVIMDNESIDFGGGIGCRSSTIINCLIVGNLAKKQGGGICSYKGANTFKNCTIVNNRISAASGAGGVEMEALNDTLLNCIVWGNSHSNINFSASPNISHSVSYPDLEYGINNFAEDPLFVNTNKFNYRLSAQSPYINQGLNEAWMETGVDLDGNPRLRGAAVDLGSYEYYAVGTQIFLR